MSSRMRSVAWVLAAGLIVVFVSTTAFAKLKSMLDPAVAACKGKGMIIAMRTAKDDKNYEVFTYKDGKVTLWQIPIAAAPAAADKKDKAEPGKAEPDKAGPAAAPAAAADMKAEAEPAEAADSTDDKEDAAQPAAKVQPVEIKSLKVYDPAIVKDLAGGADKALAIVQKDPKQGKSPFVVRSVIYRQPTLSNRFSGYQVDMYAPKTGKYVRSYIVPTADWKMDPEFDELSDPRNLVWSQADMDAFEKGN